MNTTDWKNTRKEGKKEKKGRSGETAFNNNIIIIIL
jgi:hypothetical protein